MVAVPSTRRRPSPLAHLRAPRQDLSHERIAVELTADGVPTATGGRRWAASSISYILKDRACMGEGSWGRTVTARTANGKRTSRPHTDGQPTIPLRFPAIVSPQLWHAAHAVQICGAVPAVRTTPDTYLLFGGMVRCGEHDMVMSATKGSAHNRYRCARRMPTSARAFHQVRSADLDAAVWSDFTQKFALQPHFYMGAAQRLAAESEQRLEEMARRRVAIEQRLTALGEESAYLLRLGRQTRIALDKIEASIKEVNDEEAALHDELIVLEAQVTLAREDLPKAGEIERVCERLRAAGGAATPTERRSLLEAFQVTVTMEGMTEEGYRYRIDGIVPEMTMHGVLRVHAHNALGITCGTR